jgi:uncharacterized BrkB/YihY/UPF0761 family membrane protein
MADVSQHGSLTTPRTIGSGYLFGVPLGDLGFFTSLIMSVAIGFAAFFAATFCAIVSLLFYNTATHSAVDFALTYRRVGLPVGLLVLVLALSYLGTLWVRRHLRKA